MLKRINDFLAGWPMTLVGGVFLLASFLLPRLGVPQGQYAAWVSVIVCGVPLVYLALWRIRYNKGISKISSALLISLAMVAALLIGDLFAAGEVAFIMAIGALLEDMTTNRARRGLENLLALSPLQARLVREGTVQEVPLQAVVPGDIVRVLPGEIVPVDGVILAGETSIDQSAMTGESLPVDKGPGDPVYSGTLNRFGAMDFRATAVGENSSLQRLIRMVEEADKNQAPTQRLADKWASFLVPVALLIALGAYVFTGDIVRAVTVMVVFCPCALVLSTPTAIMAAIGQATRQGVIIKSGAALERMGQVKTIAFDKTGTLTRGELTVSDILPAAGEDPERLLRLAAAAESRSEHPLGKAIAAYAEERGLPLPEVDLFHMSAGRGIRAQMEGKTYLLGSEPFLAEEGIALGQAADALDRLRGEGKASVIVAEEDRIIGVLGLYDQVRPDAAQAMASLRRLGMRTVLLTGDHPTAAKAIARQVGIPEEDVFAQLLPEEKMKDIQALQQSGPVCMIGDGVNDAPALKLADVGVAMGAMGSDIAVEAADVALMTEDLSRLPYLKWLSNATVRTIRTAITLSMCINFVAVTLSVLGRLTPTTGALVHNAGSCFVVALAALLYDRKYKG